MLELDDIRQAAHRAGFSLCGVAPYRRMPEHLERLERWLGDGRHTGLGYMERNREKRADPRGLMPGTRSVIVCAVNYRNSAWDTPPDDRPKIASYAFTEDYHATIKRMLAGVLAKLQEKYPGLTGRRLTDSAPIFEKAWAVEAGLGWISRNSLLVTPQYGSSVLLGELLVDMPVDRYDRPMERDGCGNCNRCVDHCPNGAIGPDRTIDTNRCISRLTVEPDPPGGAVSLHNWIFGCDACQICCPHNSGKPLHDNTSFAPRIDPTAMDRAYWERTSLQEFKALFAGTPLERPGLEEIYRKARR
ncbi:MAG: tRNA epoxyqueuosine(34) reductase QueG, partial [Alistipes sp.]|nr:tRNA epoxyqueuosine(34) reductase QueG [Alistipes sp.]